MVSLIKFLTDIYYKIMKIHHCPYCNFRYTQLRLKTTKQNYNWVIIAILALSFITSCSIIVIRYAFPKMPFQYPKMYNKYIVEFTAEEKQKIQNKAVQELGFRLYTIQKKDNFWKVAKANNVDINTILGCNPYLETIYAFEKQEIIVPNNKGIIHFVRRGERLSSISKLYNVPISEIKKYNKLQWWRFKTINEGDILFIPNAYPQVMTEKMAKFFYKREMFVSPIAGAYSSGFGWRIHPVYRDRRFHKGLDIAAKVGTPVCAAADGVVIFSGWAGGYGKLIKIQHENGYVTGYGHLSKCLVRVGTKVKAGQIIAKSGNTGTSTGPHLCFTIFRNNKPVNPALYLW